MFEYEISSEDKINLAEHDYMSLYNIYINMYVCDHEFAYIYINI